MAKRSELYPERMVPRHGKQYPEHMMLGTGGKLLVPESESRVLDKVWAAADKLYQQERDKAKRHELLYILTQVGMLADQVREGYHRNPVPQRVKAGAVLIGPMVVHRVMSRQVHDVRYTHATDGEDYQHEFERPTLALAIERGGHRDVLLTAPDGAPVWEDF